MLDTAVKFTLIEKGIIPVPKNQASQDDIEKWIKDTRTLAARWPFGKGKSVAQRCTRGLCHSAGLRRALSYFRSRAFKRGPTPVNSSDSGIPKPFASRVRVFSVRLCWPRSMPLIWVQCRSQRSARSS